MTRDCGQKIQDTDATLAGKKAYETTRVRIKILLEPILTAKIEFSNFS